ncbi:radical SAM protein [Candidatus Parcubacteria bacterium]|nr:MAG: radical SAM protein [Candidatus Parcubacteria bacterium]
MKDILEQRPKFPSVFAISVSDICNLNCTICGTFGNGNTPPDRHKPLMPFKDWRRIIDSLESRDTTIALTSWGEIFLNQNVIDMIDYTIHKGVKFTGVNTNGTLFTEELQHRLINIKVLNKFFVEFSIDGLKKSCEKQRKGINYDKVVAYIDHFIDLKKSKQHDIGIWIRMVIGDHSEEEIQAFIRFWGNKGVDAIHVQTNTYQDNGICKFDRKKLLSPDFLNRKISPRYYCKYLDNWFCLKSDLKGYSVCCRDWFYSGKHDFSQRLDFYDAWNSDTYHERIKHQYDNVESSMCFNCEYKYIFEPEVHISERAIGSYLYAVHERFFSKAFFRLKR